MKKLTAICAAAMFLLCGCGRTETPSFPGVTEFPDLSKGYSDYSGESSADSGYSGESAESGGNPENPENSGSSPSTAPEIPVIPVETPFASRDLRHITLPLTNDHTNSRVLTIDGENLTLEVKNGDWVTDSARIGSIVFSKVNAGNGSLVFTLDGTRLRKSYVNVELWDDESIVSYRIKHDEDGYSFPDVIDIAVNNAEIAASPSPLTYEQTLKYITKDGKPDNAAAVLEKIRTLSNKICRGQRTDYDKLRAISRWVSENIYYDHPAYKAGIPAECLTLEYMLEHGSSVCGGYAAMTSALCEAQGITCLHISGAAINQVNCYAEANNGARHEWNYAVVGNRGVWVDSGWNSRSNLYGAGEFTKDSISYKYFDIGSEVFALDHKASSAQLRTYFPE